MSNIFSHGPSKGAKALCKELGWPDVRTAGSKTIAEAKALFCWGNLTNMPSRMFAKFGPIYNPPDIVSGCVNKSVFFENMKAASDPPRTVPWTTDAKEAISWIDSGKSVIARKVLSGHSGDGIVFYEDSDLKEFLNSKLFTQYVKNIAEYRVHFAFDKQIDIQRKGLRNGVDPEKIDKRVKSHKNGFVYIRNNIGTVPDDVGVQAAKAFAASKLHYGAVDVLYNAYYNQAFVLEINTAPGLEGETVKSYADAFRSAVR